MANDQFQLPGERPLQQALQTADSFQYSPERQPEPYQHIKDIENRIHSYRRTALEIEARRKLSILETILGVRHQKVTLEGLIEQESRIGGELFGPHNRLWLSHKGSTPFSSQNNLGDWYHVQETVDAFGRKNETTLHFETHPSHITKIHNAQRVDLRITELEILTRAIELYEENVRERLYPFDQEIHDLVAEMDEEASDVREKVEDAFGQEAVARVLAEYRAKKGLSRDDYDRAA